MPAWNLSELMSMATARIGRRDDISASTVSFWVNEAYSDVVDEFPHALMEGTQAYSVVSGTSRLDLPADHLESIDLSWDTIGDVGSARTLEKADPRWADAQGYYPVGRPQRWFVYGNAIQLWPSADSYSATTSGRSFLLRYRKRASDLTDLSAVPSVDTEWRKAILYLSEAYLHEYVGNEIEGSNARGRYAMYVSAKQDVHARRQSNTEMSASLPLRRSRY